MNNNLIVVIVNGKPTVGKTTFENICKEELGSFYCQIRSTIDIVKEIAYNCGWHGEKDSKSRKFLSDLKDLLSEYNNLPFKDICRFLNDWESDLAELKINDCKHVYFVDAREPKNIQELKEEFNGVTLLIRKEGDENIESSNHADADIFNYDYDYVIWNDGSIEDLKHKAIAFLNEIFKDIKVI